MRIEQELAQVTPENDSVLTVGVFDGVHRGHRQLLDALTAEAAAKGCVPGVLTFRNHPDSVFRADFRPQYITSLDKRIRLMKECGVGFVVPVTFDQEGAYFYFVNSYYAPLVSETIAVSEYGIDFTLCLAADLGSSKSEGLNS